MTGDRPVEEAAQPGDAEEPGQPEDGLTEAQRRCLRTQVFGEVLPDRTQDECGAGWSEGEPRSDAPDRTEEWLRRQIPPHHG